MSCEFCNKKARVTLPIVDTKGMQVCSDHALILHPIMAIHSGCQCEHCGCSCRETAGCSFRGWMDSLNAPAPLKCVHWAALRDLEQKPN